MTHQEPALDFHTLLTSPPAQPIAVAEIGTGHQGDLQRGLELIDAAAEAGADVAKFQVVFADEILPPEAGEVPLPGGMTPLYQVFRNLERPLDFYLALAEHTKARGLSFWASPFGKNSVQLLQQIGVEAWKVASPELNHEELVEQLSQTGLPLVLSTGVSQLGDIERALAIHAAASPSSPVGLLHCVTSYPAPEDNANLLCIPSLRNIFGVPVGLSDHSLNPILLPALASALGTFMVEKHFTLPGSQEGLDDPVALKPQEFAQMCAAMKHFAPKPSASERNLHGFSNSSSSLNLQQAVQELSQEFGAQRLRSCLGDGIKRLASAEEANYGRTNRSLHARRALNVGDVLTPENSAFLRTEKILRPGLPPRERHQAYGRTIIHPIPAGEGIRWEDLGAPPSTLSSS